MARTGMVLKLREGELEALLAGTEINLDERAKLEAELRDVRTKLLLGRSAGGTSTAYHLLLTYYLLRSK